MRGLRTWNYLTSHPSEGEMIQQTWFTHFVDHLKTPLFLNGYALVISALTTSAFGMAFWVLAAHLYSPEIVGINSALISAMMLLAGISQLNLTNVLVRFVRTMGKQARRFITITYLVGIVIATVAGWLFLHEVNHWAPELGFIRSHLILAVWFFISIVGWSIYSLQDGNLTGLRLATWVPVKNTVYAIIKIVIMVLLASTIPYLGIFMAWTVGSVVVMVPTFYFIFRFLIPRLQSLSSNVQPFKVNQKVFKFILADNLGGLSWIVCTYLLPVIVATRLNPSANAYYYLSWTIANTLFLIAPNMGSSFVVETSAQPEKLAANLRQVVLQISRIIVPIVIVVTIGAPIILQIFGRDYSLQGSLLLRYLSMSTLPNMVISLFICVARVQQRKTALLLTQITSSLSIMLLSYIFLPFFGINGVGLAFLTSQTFLALVIVLLNVKPLIKIVFGESVKPENGTLFEVKEFNLPQVIIKRTERQYLLSFHHLRSRIRAFNQAIRISGRLPGILKSIPDLPSTPSPLVWKKIYPVPTVNDQQVFFIGPNDQMPLAVIKTPMTLKAYQSICNEIETIASLSTDPRLQGWNKIVPRVLTTGRVGRFYYLVEGALPGVTAHQLMIRNNDCDSTCIQDTAAASIIEFHRLTATPQIVNAGHIKRWVEEPVSILKRLPICYPYQRQLGKLNKQISDSLLGRQISLSWIHGDFAPGNILMSWDGRSVTGIIDWELAEKDNIPFLDLAMFTLTTRMVIQKRELGELIREFMAGESLTKEERYRFSAANEMLPGDAIDTQALFLQCWLHHISTNVTKSNRYQNQKRWARENIISVLEAL